MPDWINAKSVEATAAVIQLITIVYLVSSTRAARKQTAILERQSQYSNVAVLSIRVLPVPETLVPPSIEIAKALFFKTIVDDTSISKDDRDRELELLTRFLNSSLAGYIEIGRCRALVLVLVTYGPPVLHLSGLLYDARSNRYLIAEFANNVLTSNDGGYFPFRYAGDAFTLDKFKTSIIDHYGEEARFALPHFEPKETSDHFVTFIYEGIDGKVWVYRQEFRISQRMKIRKWEDAQQFISGELYFQSASVQIYGEMTHFNDTSLIARMGDWVHLKCGALSARGKGVGARARQLPLIIRSRISR